MKAAAAFFCLGLAAALLSGCSNKAPHSVSSGTITGVVSAPDPAQFAAAEADGPLSRLASLVLATVQADIVGIAPVAGATVELVRLDDAGAVVQVLDSQTTDSNGVYTFTGTPDITDSSLAVRVVGQTVTMRAIVTGSVVNISPVTEVITGAVLGTGAPLQNFTVAEVAALHSVLQGMDHDVTGLAFDAAVSTIEAGEGPLFAQLLADFSAAGDSSAILRNGNYSIVDMGTVLRDPTVVSVLPNGDSEGGIELDSGQGALVFPSNDDRPSPGILSFGAFLHDLTSVSDLRPTDSDDALPYGLSLGDLLHVVTSKRQLLIADTADPNVTAAGIGAITANGSVMVYPVDSSVRINDQLSFFGMGLRFAARSFQPTGLQLPLDLTLLDPAGGSATAYHEISLNEVMSGSTPGPNALTLTTMVGSVTYDSAPITATFDESKDYGTFSESAAAADSLRINLTSFDVSQASSSTQATSGLYYVFANNGQVQFRDTTTGTVLGYGSTPVDDVRTGEIVGSHHFSGGFDVPVTQVQRTFSVAIRSATGLANSSISGTYNLVQYSGYLSGDANASPPTGAVESAIRYGTISLDGAGAVTGGNLYQKRATLDLAAATSAVVPNSSGQSGVFTTATAAAAGQVFSLVVGGVSVFSFTSSTSGEAVAAADIDSGISAATANLNAVNISVAGTAAGGDLVFTKTNGAAFDIVVTNQFSNTVGGTGGFAGTDFQVGTHTVSNGTPAVPATPTVSGASGAFATATAGAGGETFSLEVGGVTVFTFTSAQAGDTVTASTIQTGLDNAASNLSSTAGISFTGTIAGDNVVFTKSDGTDFDIVVTNAFTGTVTTTSGGFAGADFGNGSHTINNGSAAVASTSGASGVFTTAVAGNAGETFSLTVGGVSILSVTSAAASDQVTAADIDTALANGTVQTDLTGAGITVSGTAAGGDLVFTVANGTAFDITITDTFTGTPGGFAGTNFAIGTNSVTNGSPVTPNASGASGAFATATAGGASQTFTMTVGGVIVFTTTSTSAGDQVTAASIDAGIAAHASDLTTAGIGYSGTAVSGDLVFTKADGTSFDIVVNNGFSSTASAAGGFAGTDFQVGTHTVSNGTPGVPAVATLSSPSGSFATATSGDAGQTFSLTVGGVTVSSHTSTAAGQTVTDANIDADIAASLPAAGITYSGSVVGGDLQFIKADGTSFDIVVANNFSSVTTTSGGFAGADFVTGTHTIDNGSSSELSLSEAAEQQTASAGTYAVNADGTMTFTLTIGSENLSGSGAVAQEGDFIALATTSVEGARQSRGMLILVRQP